ncbi:MAG: hypothetical protein H7A25_23430 [Leptospiraceae bacterium]|nr:hypothetical protein [Leptospiraceae bacterium]MCP5502872.1 hypothetical protein [Leptospiraceae bacterium]
MSESLQHYLVYTIVSLTTIKLFYPVGKYLFFKLKKKENTEETKEYGSYKTSCARCRLNGQ